MVDVAELKIWGVLAGAVRWDESTRLASFQYYKDFVNLGYELSPIKMPLSNSVIYNFPELRIQRGQNSNNFKGLPGLLADALPDRYGNQLINVWLAQHNRKVDSINPVEKLCFMGSRAMGALEFEPTHAKVAKNTFSVEIERLINVAHKMLSQREKFTSNINTDEYKAMVDVLKIGTSAGGARPKAVIAFNSKSGEIRSGQTSVPKGFEHWLLKLDGVSNIQFGASQGYGRVEYAYYLMAKDCGIDIMESRLLEENNRAHFMTKRFDREADNTKHHIQTWCGIQHFDFSDMLSYSYEQLFQTMRSLRLTYPEAEQMFHRMVFNVLATNYDDHTKNFSFILKQGGKWELAPAYDLCYSYNPKSLWVSQQTLSINGKRTGITRDDLLKIGKANSIKKAKDIVDEVAAVVNNWNYYAKAAGVSKELQDLIESNLGVKTF